MNSFPAPKENNLQSELEQLKRTNESLEKELNMLAYAVSHDLEQPLRHIMAFSKLLGRKIQDYNDDEVQKYAEFVQNSGEVLEKRINAILKYSRLSQHEFKIASVSTESLVQNIIAKIRLDPSKAKIATKLENLPEMEIDKELLKMLLTELLENAFHFCSQEESPRVKVWGEQEGSFTSIFIEDNGIGLGTQKLERLIKLFQQADDGFPRKQQSIGIGLSMAQRAANMLGAQICHTETPEGNTQFQVLFT
ncbi:MAG: ATP-binding protein [Bacteroidota bacterium]